jgi:hypothetical protein
MLSGPLQKLRLTRLRIASSWQAKPPLQQWMTTRDALSFHSVECFLEKLRRRLIGDPPSPSSFAKLRRDEKLWRDNLLIEIIGA